MIQKKDRWVAAETTPYNDTRGKVIKSQSITLLKRALEQKQKQNLPSRGDFVEFLKTVTLDESGKHIHVDKITELIATTMQNCCESGKHLSVIVAPGIGKSTLARNFMLQRIGLNQTLRTAVVMGTDNDAAQAVALCRDIVTSKNFKTVFPEIKYDFDYEKSKKVKAGKGSSEDIEMQRGFSMNKWYLRAEGQRKDPTMEACPVELKGESRRCDMALFDDIVGEMVADSPTRSKKVEKAFWATWVDGRLSNGGTFIYLQNLRNSQDLAHKLRLDKRVTSLWIGVNDDVDKLFVRIYNPPENLPVIKDPEQFDCEETDTTDHTCPPQIEFSMPLPERYITVDGNKVNIWSKEYLQSRSPEAFRRLYQLKVLSSDALMFPSFKNRVIMGSTPKTAFGFDMIGEVPIVSSEDRSRYHIAGGLDWSSQKRKGKAIVFLAQDKNSKRIIPIYHKRIKGDITAVVNLLRMLSNAGFSWDVLYAESNAIQGELNNAVKELSANSDGSIPDWVYTIVDFTTTSEKWKLENGLPEINVAFETGLLCWIDAMAPKYVDWGTWELDISQMTMEKVNVMTPDSIMALWFAWRALKDYLGGASLSGGGSGSSSIVEIRDDDSKHLL